MRASASRFPDLGASRPARLEETLRAPDFVPAPVNEVIERLERILGNRPKPLEAV